MVYLNIWREDSHSNERSVVVGGGLLRFFNAHIEHARRSVSFFLILILIGVEVFILKSDVVSGHIQWDECNSVARGGR